MSADLLAPYACHPQMTRGRHIQELPAPTRSDFQRDRDRIVHSSAFRRLVYKTQVFINHEGDMFRTRLTHSLEVAQLGRSIARTLKLNEDLVEAISLAHDLGHTPFGHAGQDALHECMREHGGFEHNIQSLRVVDRLEKRYPHFDGLNLCYEAREGILKHCSAQVAKTLGDVGQRFLSHQRPSMEAQLTNLADEIAYNAHDIDDGVRSGLLSLEQMEQVPLFLYWRDDVLKEYPQLRGKRLLFETIRRMLSAQVYDVIDATDAQLKHFQPGHVDDVRAMPPLVVFSPEMRSMSHELKTFLLKHLYRHPQVMDTMNKARQIVHDLFHVYCTYPHEASPEISANDIPRQVADYIAGMTDRFAIYEHARLTGEHLFPADSSFYSAGKMKGAL
ncbi:Deoxyguanosinetriphosphate triphosphohydrolase-like protein [Saezia sanguinis]|uniref:Deoxyguanosinetriphosphate triphosphohydrolase-like protein n=1 Tax=Saezia sanguinis TaxID=1965230 RepID=A0A433SDY2_9BURK|nr:deoxyguanosinetriphosphate triphosphohydrolase [Saezia sanguinis]RUS66948.1 Deoxyguanosinetriphosphate triphosphohydrolase-like protein [Saezia sanguinis]